MADTFDPMQATTAITVAFNKANDELEKQGVPRQLLAHATFGLGISLLLEQGLSEDQLDEVFKTVKHGIKANMNRASA